MTTTIDHHKLHLKRTFAASRDRVFRAWTDPKELKAWFHASDDWTTPVSEVDFRVGGQYRLGMQSPDADAPYVVTGVYREINEPEKLVYTWGWEGENGIETLVTVHFREQGESTEVELIHERFPSAEERDKHNEGWCACLEQLKKLFNASS